MKAQLAQTSLVIACALLFAFLGPNQAQVVVLAFMLLCGGLGGAAATGLALGGESPFFVLLPPAFFTAMAVAGSSPGMARPICFAVLVGLGLGSASLMLACFTHVGEDEDEDP